MDRRTCIRLGAGSLAGLLATSPDRASGSREESRCRVLVIGAGTAGLAAARALVDDLGFLPREVVVLEARDGLGGRIHTDRSLGVPVELGATWIQGQRGNPLTRLARRYGARIERTDYRAPLPRDDPRRLRLRPRRSGAGGGEVSPARPGCNFLGASFSYA